MCHLNLTSFCASVDQIANFLIYLFEKWYEYITINSYRSAISSFHPEHEVIKVGQTVLIKQLMTGVFNSRPPIPRYTETWDVDLVLKYILNLPEDKDLTLKQFFHTVAISMSLTSACRSSEIRKLDATFMKEKNSFHYYRTNQNQKSLSQATTNDCSHI